MAIRATSRIRPTTRCSTATTSGSCCRSAAIRASAPWIWSPLGWGKLTGKIRRGQPAKPGTRAHDIAGTGPHYDEERLFRIVDALDGVAQETRQDDPAGRAQLAAAAADGFERHHRRAQRSTSCWRISARSVGRCRTEQVATLDAASDVPPAYPVWHQRGFPMLNESA